MPGNRPVVSDGLTALYRRIGLIPEDTEFNRRATEYAREAENLVRNRENQRKKAIARKLEQMFKPQSQE
jgi:hypothetical protein